MTMMNNADKKLSVSLATASFLLLAFLMHTTGCEEKDPEKIELRQHIKETKEIGIYEKIKGLIDNDEVSIPCKNLMIQAFIVREKNLSCVRDEDCILVTIDSFDVREVNRKAEEEIKKIISKNRKCFDFDHMVHFCLEKKYAARCRENKCVVDCRK